MDCLGYILIGLVVCQSLLGTVQRHGKKRQYHWLPGLSTWKVSISLRYGSTLANRVLSKLIQLFVSITHRYGSTTVFTAFSVFIIPQFPCFSTFFSKKVGQPLHSKFPQSLDSTGFFIFVKIGSEVHRLFSRFFVVFGTFPCCFCSGSLDFTALEVHRLFLQIF